MKNIIEFIKESSNKDIWTVYTNDEMYTYYLTSKEAHDEADRLNKENPDNNASVKKEKENDYIK